MYRLCYLVVLIMMVSVVVANAQMNNSTTFEALFVQASKKCSLSFNSTGSPSCLIFSDISIDAAFADRPYRNVATTNEEIYQSDFESVYGVTVNSSNAALVAWKGSKPVYTVAIISTVRWNSNKKKLYYTLQQADEQRSTNVFPARATKRAKKRKNSTLKLKNCAFFTDDYQYGDMTIRYDDDTVYFER